MSFNFGDLIEAIERKIPADRVALAHGDEVVNWGELRHRSNNLARALIERGLRPGERVAFYAYNSADYMVALMACWKARGTHVNVNYRYVADELAYILADSDATVLFYDARLRDAVAAVADRSPLVRTWVEWGEAPGDTPAFAERLEALDAGDGAPLDLARDPADRFFIYTGGTTGMPKGVVWTHADLNAIGLAVAAAQGLPIPEDVEQAASFAAANPDYPKTVIGPPIMHGTGLLSAYGALLGGGMVATLPSRSFRAEEALDAIDRWRANRLVVVGDAFARPIAEALDAEPARWNVASMRVIISSGVMWTQGVKDRLIHHMPEAMCQDNFSSSEAIGMGVSITTRDGTVETAKFMVGPRCRVLDEHDRDVVPGSGVRGIVALGPPNPVEYHKDSEKTARTFRTIDGVRYSIPGDYAEVLADGTLVLLGRGSACINSAGEKIFPEEVEEALKLCPGVADALVFGVPDPKWGQAVAAVVQAADGYAEGAARDHLRAHLAGYKLPKLLVATDQSLRAPNGKADYAKAKGLAGVA
ncbi:AMP-binding protein [uncultured Sphingomonas sp.]|uniref:AMP-binding protein n=1 Tax=uncultured Sphingomonas sp. TaxID=158754 RepID=UPI00262D5F32|nr:AMP-binding protein [uncultured Sphingomonas sp.]